MTDAEFWCLIIRCLKGIIAAIEQMLARERARQEIKEPEQD